MGHNLGPHRLRICDKVRQKLHVLAIILSYISQAKLHLILGTFLRSQFSYCPQVWITQVEM